MNKDSEPLQLPGFGADAGRLTLAAALLCLALLCLVVLLAPPGRGILKRNLRPADMPWSGYGLSEVYISPAGGWVLTRRGYADRNTRYNIDAAGNLSTVRDSIRPYQGGDVSGSFNSNRQRTKSGAIIQVMSRKGTGYRRWQIEMRDHNLSNYLNPLPRLGEVGPIQLPQREAEIEKVLDAMPSGVTINLNQRYRIHQSHVLDGHWLYEVYDAACYVNPFLYVTTDRQRCLHKLLIDDSNTDPVVKVISSVALELTGEIPDRRCRLLHDPQHGICLLRPDGSRHWFDLETLASRGSDQLPGDWEAEYASLDFRPGVHNPNLGTALTKAAYERIQRCLMLGFLASLLGLAMLWRPQWKSTLARTTEAMSLKKESPDTSSS